MAGRSVHTYQCIALSDFLRQQNIVLTALQLNPDQTLFHYSKSCVSMVSSDKRSAGAIQGPEAARTYLENYLRAANKVYSACTKSTAQLFSKYLSLLSVTEVPEGWLATFHTKLPLFGTPQNPAIPESASVEDSLTEVEFDGSGAIARVTLSPLPILRSIDAELAVSNEEILANLDPVYGYDMLAGTCLPKALVLSGAQIALSKSPPRTFSDQAPINLNSDFDKDRVVTWYIPPLVIRDVSPLLEPGTKTIRLKGSPKSSLIDVFHWKGDRYGVTSVPVDSVSSSYTSSTSSLSNLLNDLSHIRSRVSGNSDRLDRVMAELNSGALTLPLLGRTKFLDKVVSFNSFLGVDVKNKPLTMERSLSLITPLLDFKQVNGRLWSENTLALPLSEDWFRSDPVLSERYSSVWADPALNRLGGDISASSGEGTESSSEVLTITNELRSLKNLVGATSAKDSPEAQWLRSLTEERLAKVVRVIFIHLGTWYMKRNQRYAQAIGLMNSFGPVHVMPLHTVLLHELNVNTSGSLLLQGDTHIDVDDTERAWEQVSKSHGFTLMNKAKDVEDDLYQCARDITAVFCAAFIRWSKR